MLDPVLAIFSLLFGLCIGSFANAVIYRVPRKISLSRSRSHCPQCDKLIYWYENIPLFSYLFLKGRCSGCNFRIPVRYPLVELAVGIFAFLITPQELSSSGLLHYVFSLSVFTTFLCIFLIDIEHKLIPNVLNIYLAFNLFLGIVMIKGPVFWGLGALVGILFPLTITYLFYLLKGQIGLGGGDIKLYGALGLYLGPLGVIHTIFLSCFLGALVGGSLILFKILDRKAPIPFGPFIILVGFVQIFFPSLFKEFMGLLIIS